LLAWLRMSVKLWKRLSAPFDSVMLSAHSFY
jgi:hypothetical protein